jgi:hypothetical protein
VQNLVGEGEPEPGDLVICAECCAVLAFDYAPTLRAFTAREFGALPLEVREAAILGQRVMEQRPGRKRRGIPGRLMSFLRRFMVAAI